MEPPVPWLPRWAGPWVVARWRAPDEDGNHFNTVRPGQLGLLQMVNADDGEDALELDLNPIIEKARGLPSERAGAELFEDAVE